MSIFIILPLGSFTGLGTFEFLKVSFGPGINYNHSFDGLEFTSTTVVLNSYPIYIFEYAR
jgi:hypothetical protein